MKKSIILPILMIIPLTLSSCGLIDSLKKDIAVFNNDDYYNMDDELANMDNPKEETKEIVKSITSKNFTVSLNNPQYAIEPQRDGEMTIECEWSHDDISTIVQVDYSMFEETIEYSLDDYNDMEETSGFKVKQKGKTYEAYYRNNNKLYTKLVIFPIETITVKDDTTIITEDITPDIFENETFANAITFSTKKNEGSTIVTDDDFEVVVAPEEYSEVNFTDAEKDIIYKLIYNENIANNLLEQLNKVGVYEIKEGKLLPSDSGYLIQVTAKDGKFIGHLNGDFHVDYIQKDGEDGDYLYLEKKKD